MSRYAQPKDAVEAIWLRLSMEVDDSLLRIWPCGLRPDDHKRISDDAAEKRRIVEEWEKVHGRLI